MTAPLVFRPEAEADVAEAYSWYHDRGHGLAEEFLQSLENCLTSIQRRPEGCAVVHKTVRRALLRKFPYGVFYVHDGRTITVVACFHASRDPKSWQAR